MKIKYVDCVETEENPVFGRLDKTEGLLVDSEYAGHLRNLGIQSAESLYSFAKADPVYTQKIFDMNNLEFETALSTLATRLSQTAPEFMQIEQVGPKEYSTGVPLPKGFNVSINTESED